MRIGRGWSGPSSGGGGGGGGGDPTWTRYLLNSGSTKTDPSGGATVTVNSESASTWSDISQAAQNEKEPVNLTNFSLGLTKSDGTTAVTFADLFVIQAQIIVHQFTDTTGGRNGAAQTPVVYVANAAVPSTSSHYYFGEGLGYTHNGTTVKLARIYSADASAAPAFTTQQIKSNLWNNQFRVNLTMSNTIGRGCYLSLAEYRNYNNTQFQSAWNDIEGIDPRSGLTPVITFGASEQVFLNLYFPGLNSGGSGVYDLVNTQFKLFYNVTILNQDASA